MFFLYFPAVLSHFSRTIESGWCGSAGRCHQGRKKVAAPTTRCSPRAFSPGSAERRGIRALLDQFVLAQDSKKQQKLQIWCFFARTGLSSHSGGAQNMFFLYFPAVLSHFSRTIEDHPRTKPPRLERHESTLLAAISSFLIGQRHVNTSAHVAACHLRDIRSCVDEVAVQCLELSRCSSSGAAAEVQRVSESTILRVATKRRTPHVRTHYICDSRDEFITWNRTARHSAFCDFFNGTQFERDRLATLERQQVDA